MSPEARSDARPCPGGAQPSPAHVFVGLARELAALDRAFRECASGRGRVVMLVGEPGIGKTRLAEELGAMATDRGARVLWGRRWESGGAPAFWPWVQIFRSYAGGIEDGERALAGIRYRFRHALIRAGSPFERAALSRRATAHTRTEIHALELLAAARGAQSAPVATHDTALAVRSGDAGELLDSTARAAYRIRLRGIEAELHEAEGNNDPGQVERLQPEREALEAELVRAFGLARRVRRSGSATERARLNVTRAIKSAIARIDASDAELGRHMARCVRTGTFCAYLPDPRAAVPWTVVA